MPQARREPPVSLEGIKVLADGEVIHVVLSRPGRLMGTDGRTKYRVTIETYGLICGWLSASLPEALLRPGLVLTITGVFSAGCSVLVEVTTVTDRYRLLAGEVDGDDRHAMAGNAEGDLEQTCDGLSSREVALELKVESLVLFHARVVSGDLDAVRALADVLVEVLDKPGHQ